MQKNYHKEFNSIYLLSFKNFLSVRSLISLVMEFQIFAPKYLITVFFLFCKEELLNERISTSLPTVRKFAQREIIIKIWR